MSFDEGAIRIDEPFTAGDLAHYRSAQRFEDMELLELWERYQLGTTGRVRGGVRHRQLGAVLVERGLISEAEMARLVLGVFSDDQT